MMKVDGETVDVEISDNRLFCRFVTTELPIQKVSVWFQIRLYEETEESKKSEGVT